MFYESRLDTHDTHTRPMTRTRAVGWSRAIARHRAPSRDAVRRPGRRSPVAAAGPRGILLFLTVRARVARRLRDVARHPSVTASIHPSVPHRTAKKPREGPPVEVESTFSPDRMARTDGTPPTDGRDGRTKSKSNEIERTNEGAREETARARRRDPAVSLPSSFLRSFVRSRSFASSRGANQNHKPIVFEWIMGFGTTKTPGKSQSSSLCR